MTGVPAVVHLDLDGATHIFRAHGRPPRRSGDPLFTTGLAHFLDFFDHANVRATLFVIAEDLADPEKRELVQEAARRGHELASHSFTHRKLTALSVDERRREVSESRVRIAQSVGVEVRGFRAPGFHLDRASLELVVEAGYTYDSSVFPGHHPAGIAGAAEAPFLPIEGNDLIELPLPRYRPLPFPFHPSYSLVLGEWYFRLGLERFRHAGAPLVLLFHLTDLADPLSREHLGGWRDRVFTLSHLAADTKRRRCQVMLDLVARHYTIVETRELLRRVMR